MRTWPVLGILVIFCIGIATTALGDDWKEQSGKGLWWQGDYKEEYWDGPCKLKLEAERDEFKEEVKCE